MAGLNDYTGTFNDKLDQYLADQGNVGTINDKLSTDTTATGNVGEKLRAFFLNEVTYGPADPTGLATSNITSTAITLTWDDDAGVDHWEVYLDGSLVDDTVATNSYEFTGLEENTAYVLGVKAVDGDGNKSALATKVASTLNPALEDALLLESGDYILLETGDKLLLE